LHKKRDLWAANLSIFAFLEAEQIEGVAAVVDDGQGTRPGRVTPPDVLFSIAPAVDTRDVTNCYFGKIIRAKNPFVIKSKKAPVYIKKYRSNFKSNLKLGM